ncbi:MAG: hypothetical protein AAGD25_11235 [Cyanobacteria bacterium P01_F01_bin.150]
MKPLELVRIIAIIVVGIILVLVGQPWLYRSNIIFLDVFDLEQWLATEYLTSSYWVLGAAVVSTFVWYFAAASAKPLKATDTASWRLLWWGILFVPIISVGIALFLQTSDTTRYWLAVMYIFDVMILYWLPTASSSPGSTKYLPPGSKNIRDLLDPI